MAGSFSAEQICSKALGLLGQGPIADLAGTKPYEVLCNQVYAITRDALLQGFAWSFATRRVALALDTEEPAFGWSYRFTLPNDFLRLLSVDPSTARYVVEYGYVLGEVEALSVQYVARIIEPGRFDPCFVDALAKRIAVELSLPILKKPSASQFAQALYEESIRTARHVDAIQDRPKESTAEERSSWLAARL